MNTIQGLADLFLNSLNHDNTIRRNAEANLQSLEAKPSIMLLVLQLISLLCQPSSDSPSAPAIRQAASVYFKNVIKKRWSPENTEDDTIDAIVITDRETIKIHLIDLMSTTPTAVQKQLAESVSIIAKYDFPHNWQKLLPQLISKLDGDIRVIQGVMLTANCIFKKFRHCYKSDSLFQEIKDCLMIFQAPLLEMFKRNGEIIMHFTTTAADLNDLQITIETHRIMARIYYSLNWQDIPEFFEDHIAEWMEQFMKFLTYKNRHLVNDNEDLEPGPIENLQVAILENLTLYASKYEEEFNPYLGIFTQAIWQLLMEVDHQQKYDILATSSIKFLSSVCSKQMNIALFTDKIIKDIVEHIVVKNVTATEADEELFEDNPIDYIRKDIEGSDADTRRRSAMDLVRALLKFFGRQTSQYCVGYINVMFDNYTKTLDWKAKDAALHLFLSTSVMTSSSASGANDLNPDIDILGIFNSHVLPEISDPYINNRSIVKADALKLICMFRSHLPSSMLLGLIANVITHLSSESIVVQTYAALCLEKFLSLKDRNPSNGTMTARITNVHLHPHLQTLLSGLFTALSNPNHPENDYIMKCILRVLVVVGNDVAPISFHVLPPLVETLDRVSKNPTNPHFNHYLFECLAIIVKSVTSSEIGIDAICIACNQFESLLFPIFQVILSQDVVEFVPYAFQIFAQLLNARTDLEGLSEFHLALFPPLLSPSLWERKGNVPALTDLFRAYISKGISDLITANHLEGILGVFQKLLSLKSTECYAFKLLNAIINCTPLSTLSPYLPTIFGLLLTRLQEHMKDTKTPKYCKSFVHTICFFAAIHGGQSLENIFLSIDPSGGLLNTLITDVWSHNSTACVSNDKADIKHIIIGGTKILCQSNVKQQYIAWGSLLKSIVILLDIDFSKVGLDLDDYNSWGLDDDAADREFDSAYSKLAYGQISDPDGTVDINSASEYFTSSIGELFKQLPGKFPRIIQQALEHHQLQLLQGLCQQNGVIIM